MQMSVDGFVAGPNGELDWMTWNWDDKLKAFVNDLTDSSDTILLGRKMTDGFVSHWSGITDPADESYPFARKMVETPKIVFSRTLSESPWDNTTIESELASGVERIKAAKGQDIVAYGGAGFVTSLVREDLIDDYFLFVNPAAIGSGMTIFGDIGGTRGLKLVESIPFECGVVVNHYQPR
jgi:dihydrofolate reductase